MLKDTKNEKKKGLKRNQFLACFLSETFSSRSLSPALVDQALGTVVAEPLSCSPSLLGAVKHPERSCAHHLQDPPSPAPSPSSIVNEAVAPIRLLPS